MRVGDVKKYLPKDDDEQVFIAWWEYGDGESWPEWLTQELWDELVYIVEGRIDWSYTHEAICYGFEEEKPEEEE